MSHTIYLAEPIDQAGEGTKRGIGPLLYALHQARHNIYRPASAWYCGGKPDRTIETVNRTALAQADAMIAVLPAGIPSIGVPMEIAAADLRGIPTIVISDIDSFVLAAMSNVTVVRPDDDHDKTAQLAVELLGQELRARDQRLLKALVEHNIPEPIVYMRTDPDTPHLKPALTGDAGYDLTTVQDTYLAPGVHALIPCGVRIELPPGTFGWVVSRSSTYRDWGLQVLPGIIDNGYRGDYYANVVNTSASGKAVLVPAGTRLCQLVLLPVLADHYRPVEGVVRQDTERGTRGFGSTNGDQSAAVACPHGHLVHDPCPSDPPTLGRLDPDPQSEDIGDTDLRH